MSTKLKELKSSLEKHGGTFYQTYEVSDVDNHLCICIDLPDGSFIFIYYFASIAITIYN